MVECIKTVVEILAILALLYGFSHEDKIVAWEQRFSQKLATELAELISEEDKP